MSQRFFAFLRRFGFLALLLAFVAVIGASLAYYLQRLQAADLAAHARIAALYARNFEEQVTQSLNVADLALQNSGELAAGDAVASRRLAAALRGQPLLRSLSLLDDDGHIVLSSHPANRGAIVQRQGLLPPLAGFDQRLHIGARLAGRDFDAAGGDFPLAEGDVGVSFIPVLRAVESGGARRLLAAALNPEYFINQLSLRLRDEDALAVLVRFDRQPLLSTRPGDPLLRDVAAMPFWAALADVESGGFEWQGGDGKRWLVAFRASRDYPLLVLTGIERDRAIASWRDEARHLLAIVLPALLALLLLALALFRAQQREALRSEQAAAERAERERLGVLFDALPAKLLLLDPEGQVQLVNGEWLRFLESLGAQLADGGVGESFTALFQRFENSIDDAPIAGVAAVLAGSQELFAHELEIRSPRGSLWLQMLVRPLHGGRLQGAIVLLFDVSARRAAEDGLRLASLVLESTVEGVVITNADRRIVWVNEAFCRITGYGADEVVGETPRALAAARQSPALAKEILRALRERGMWSGEIANRRKGGAVFPEWLSVSTVRDAQGRVSNYVALFSDISERKASEERIRFLSEHDFLTGLPNRALFEDRIEQLIVCAQRTGERFAVLFIDLDRFKTINDTCGHTVGDLLLKEVTARIGSVLRNSDTVSRQGGDEFIVMLRQIEAGEDAARVAEKLIEAIGAPCRLDGHEVLTSPSIGIALYPDDGETMSALIRNADTAMYHSKDQGRNTFSFFSPAMNSAALERLALERGLAYAIQRRELSLHFQPQLAFADGQLLGAEVLLRWHSAELGRVPPERFIRVAEETGLIRQIGEWVIGEACRQGAAWQRAGLPSLTLAVNVSAVQFAQKDFVDRVRDILASSGYDGRRLEFEVTESVLMESPESRIGVFEALRASGIALSIDDFGTGYSSLSYLRRLPIDKLKIDRSFIADLGADVDDETITETIIRMAQQMGLKVVAEGVETAAQADFLRQRGCDAMQGFLVSAPLPADAFAAALRKQAEEGWRFTGET